jgi:hypothetical protein
MGGMRWKKLIERKIFKKLWVNKSEFQKTNGARKKDSIQQKLTRDGWDEVEKVD